jgi:hypothetical protein
MIRGAFIINDCINCQHCTNIDECEHEGYCMIYAKEVFVQIDGCDDFEWREKE